MEDNKQVKMVQSEQELSCYSEKIDKKDADELDALLKAEDKDLEK